MKTTTKIIVWAACVLVGVGVWQFVEWVKERPSGVYPAVIVQVSGCGAIDFNLCRTTVDMDGVRLIRGGDHGEPGDTVLAVQWDSRSWGAPSPRQMRKYREEQSR